MNKCLKECLILCFVTATLSSFQTSFSVIAYGLNVYVIVLIKLILYINKSS